MSENIPISDTVKTREVLIYDDSDRIRISLNAHFGVEPKVTIYKEDGTPAIEISSMEMDKDSRRIVLFGKKHNYRLYISSNENGVGATAYDEEGKFIGACDFSKNKETGEYDNI